MPHRHLKKSDTDGYAAMRVAVELTLSEIGEDRSENEIHLLTLKSMEIYADRFVPGTVPRANRHRAAQTIADRFRRTDLRGRLDVGHGIS